MTTEQSWALTPREFAALEQVFLRSLERWALERADYRNAHLGKDALPWEPADFFLGTENRAQRKIDHDIAMRKVARENFRLGKMRPGPPTDDVPAWARGAKPSGG